MPDNQTDNGGAGDNGNNSNNDRNNDNNGGGTGGGTNNVNNGTNGNGNGGLKLHNANIKPIELTGCNLAENWRLWKTRFNIFLKASGLHNETNERKVALLLHYLGENALPIFTSFNIDIDTVQFDVLIKKYDGYFNPKQNLAIERNRFFTRKQGKEESLEEFLTALKNLSMKCELDTLREGIVRDVFIIGLKEENGYIREAILNKGNITLQEMIELAVAKEMAKTESRKIEEKFVGAIGQGNNHNNYGRKYEKSYQNGDRHYDNQRQNYKAKYDENNTCTACGQIHRYSCPAKGRKCNKCHKFNHYSKCCRSNGAGDHNIGEIGLSDENSEEDDYDLFVGVINIECDNVKESNVLDGWFTTAKIFDKDVKCQLDTGAAVNLMAARTFDQIGGNRQDIRPTNVKVKTVTGNIETIGEISIKCKINKQSKEIIFIIATHKCRTIIGLETLLKFDLIKRNDQHQAGNEMRLDKIRQAIKTDEIMKMLKECCEKGWPNEKNKCDELLKPYYSIKEDLSAGDGLIFKGLALGVPTSLRKKYLEKMHNAHQGIDRALDQVRDEYRRNRKHILDLDRTTI